MGEWKGVKVSEAVEAEVAEKFFFFFNLFIEIVVVEYLIYDFCFLLLFKVFLGFYLNLLIFFWNDFGCDCICVFHDKLIFFEEF